MIDASNSAAMRRVVFPRTYRSANWRLLSTAALVPPLLCFTAPGHAQTLPSGGNVVAGTATIGAASGGRLDITQTSDRAIVEWSDFSIGAGGRVHIDNGSGATLNRVKGQTESSLNGMLTSTGSVYLINPNGVIVGESGVIDVGGSFIGSTLDIQNSKFLAGGNIELLGNSTASVRNFGKIGALGGDVVLAAVNVENHGTIEALSGTAGLAAGTFVVFADQAHSNGRLKVVTGGAGTSVSNRDTIKAAVAELRANGGNIYALAGDTRGIIKAEGVASVDGRVFLTAGAGGTVDITSTDISARAASGEGGSIVVGGTGAARVSINQDASLNASAFFNGPGGSIETSAAKVTIADDAIIMTFGSEAEAGTWTIAANDFVVGPNGNIAASTLSSALDLNNVTIKGLDESGGNSGDIVVNGALFWDANNKLTLASDRDIVINSSITANGLEAGLVLDHGAGRDYLVNLDNSARITLSGANATLNIEGQNYTLIHDVNQLQDIDLDLNGHYALAGTIDASATAGWNSGAGFKPIGEGTYGFTGILTGLGNSIDGLMIDAREVNGGKAVGLVTNLIGSIRDTLLLNGSITGKELVGGFAGFGSGTLSNVRSNSVIRGIENVGGLIGDSTGTIRQAQALAGALVEGKSNVGGIVGYGHFNENTQSLFYLSDVKSSATVKGIAPSADLEDKTSVGGVVGSLHVGVVDNAYSNGNVTGFSFVGGLIGLVTNSEIRNSASDSDVTGAGGIYSDIGGLIGFLQSSTLSDSHSRGNVVGSTAIGGLVGTSVVSTISNVTATGNVTGVEGRAVGGLIGTLWGGQLSSSSATVGTVKGKTDYGGLVGTNRGTIENSYSDNHVSAFNLGNEDNDDFGAGGLVGTNFGIIRNSSSSSSVDARTAVGGLVGYNFGDETSHGEIYDSSATGSVTATRGNVGGLAGTNSGVVSKSSATGSVSGGSRAGGLVGANDGAGAVISDSWASGDVSVPTGGNPALQGYEAGGLAGTNYAGASISRSYATGNVQGSNAIGGLVGRNLNSKITDAYATGNVEGDYWIGGFAGVNSGLISDVFASGNVYGNETVGGLVGDNFKPLGGEIPVLVQRAYASGTVSGVRRVGGLVGANSETITLAYATGAVTLRDDPYGTAGGLVGENSGLVRHTYSSGAVINDAGGIVGGLVGTNDDLNGGSIESSYWDTQNSGLLYSAGGSGRTTAQMHDQQTFAGWDFAGTWAPTESSYMPMLYGVSGVVGVAVGTVSRVYGDDNSVISNAPVTYIGNGFWNSISGTPSFTSTTDSRSNAGSYGLTGSGVSGARAQGGASRIAYVGTLQIDPRAITVSALGGRSTYGDTPGNPGLSATGLVNGEDESVLTGLYNTFGITNASGAGTYTLSVGGALTNGNYTVTALGTGTWVVDPRAITVSALGGRSTYGDTPGNPGLSATGLVNGEDASVLTGLYNTFGITNASGAGTYTLSVGGALTNGNYTVTALGTGTWVVDPRAITVSALGGRSTYGDTPGNPGLSATGLVNGEDVSVLTGLYNTFGITNASGAGTYTLSVGGALTNGNYTVTALGTGTWVVDPRAITVSALGGRSTYGDTPGNPGLSATGLVNGEDVSVLTGLYNAFGITNASGAGTYTLSVGGALTNNNYTVTALGTGTWVVDPRAITVSALGGRSTYGDTPGNPGLSATGLVNGEDVSVLTGLYNTFGITNASGAGTYTLSVGGALTNGNYTVTALGTGTWVVDPRAITVSALGGRSTYGDTPGNPGLSATGLVNGEDESVLTGLYNTFGITNASGAGTYTLSVGGALTNGNYTVTALGTGTWVVDPRAITVSALGGRSTYGDTPGNPGLSATGLVNGEDVSVLTGLYNTFGITNASGAGTYTLSVGGALTNGNYTVTALGTGTWVVDPRAITVSALGGRSTYGDTPGNPGLSATGLVNGEDVSVLTGLYNTFGITNASGAGTYTLSVGGALTNGNYTVASLGTGTWVVDPRAITVSALGGRSTYGDTPGNPGLSATGLVNGEDVSVLTGLYNTFGITNASGAGTYTLSVGGALTNGNYTVTALGTGTWVVDPRAITVSALGGRSTYGDTPGNPGLSATGLVNGEDVSVLTGLYNTFGITNASGAGTYTLSVGGALTNGNYTVTALGTGTWVVDPRAITVSALGGRSTYGDTPGNPGLSATGLVNGEDVSVLTGLYNTFGITNASGAGTYTLSVGGALTNGNYTVASLGTGTWVVDPRAITVSALGGRSTYGDTPGNPGLSATGLVNGEDVSVLTGLYNTFGITNASGAGTYTLSVGGALTNGNYTVTTLGTGTWVVDPRAITVSALGGRSTYGDTPGNPGLSATGLVNGEDASVLTGLYNTFGITNASGAGTYTLSVGGALTNGNYTVTTLGTGTWVVDPRAITVSALGGRSTYGDTPGNPGLSATGLVNGEDVSVLTGLYNTFGITNASGAGTYTLSVGGALTNGNYTVASLGTGTWVVDPRGILVQVIANDITRKYGEANPALTYTATGLIGTDQLSGNLETEATLYSDVGSYAITLGSLTAGGNYSIAFTPGTLTIVARDLYVAADYKTRAYGDDNPLLTYTVGGDGFVFGQNFTGSLTTGADRQSRVGYYDIEQGSLSAGQNYTIHFTRNQFQISPRALIVTAANQSRIYGDANPALTYRAEGLVNGDQLTGALQTGANARSAVGDYAIAQGGLQASENYTMTFNAGTLTITPRALMVAAANQTRQYGDANPALSYTATGLVNGDTLTGSLSTAAKSASNVGNYAITQGDLAASGNYLLTFQNGSLQVVPRTVIVAADNKSRQQGEANPAFTYTVTGLVNDDVVSGALTTLATESSKAGRYAITGDGLSAGANYEIRYIEGVLTVLPLPATGAGDPVDPVDPGPDYPFLEKHVPQAVANGPAFIHFLPDCSDDEEMLSVYPANLPAHPAPCPLKAL